MKKLSGDNELLFGFIIATIVVIFQWQFGQIKDQIPIDSIMILAYLQLGFRKIYKK